MTGWDVSAAGPCCSGAVARSRTIASKVFVVAKLLSSVATIFPLSFHGRAESCARSMLRVTAYRERVGSAGARPRTSRMDAESVMRKYVLSQPRQNPPGSSAIVAPTFPRRAISSTILAPRELPTMSMPSMPCSTIKFSTLSASPLNVPLLATAGDSPCPGRSSATTSRASESAGRIVFQDRHDPPMPCTSKSVGPVPCRMKFNITCASPCQSTCNKFGFLAAFCVSVPTHEYASRSFFTVPN